MNWLFPALLSPAVYAVVNFVDKYLIEDKVKDYRGMPIYGGIVGLLFGTLVYFVSGTHLLDSYNAAIILLTGVLTIWGYYFYFQALSRTETSYIISLFQMTPIMTLVFSYLLIGERISTVQYAGFILILFAVFFLSFKREKRLLTFNSTFVSILLTDIFFAISLVLIKFASFNYSLTTIVVYESWGYALGGLVLFIAFPWVRNSFLTTVRSTGISVLGIFVINECLFVLAKALGFWAVTLGPVSLVSVLSGTQVFYGVIFGVLLTLIAPHIFKEEISIRTLKRKVIASTILFIGIWCVS